LAWFAGPAIGGLVYVVLALGMMLRLWWSAMVVLVAAGAQVVVFGVLAILAIVAAGRTNDPGEMTIGVIVFGTLACVHLFVIRNLWPGSGSQSA
jgi:hypothetical protein